MGRSGIGLRGYAGADDYDPDYGGEHLAGEEDVIVPRPMKTLSVATVEVVSSVRGVGGRARDGELTVDTDDQSIVV